MDLSCVVNFLELLRVDYIEWLIDNLIVIGKFHRDNIALLLFLFLVGGSFLGVLAGGALYTDKFAVVKWVMLVGLILGDTDWRASLAHRVRTTWCYILG